MVERRRREANEEGAVGQEALEERDREEIAMMKEAVKETWGPLMDGTGEQRSP